MASVTVNLTGYLDRIFSVEWRDSLHIGSTFDAGGDLQTMEFVRLFNADGEGFLIGVLAGMVNLSLVGNNDRFTPEFEATGRIIIAASDDETLEVMIANEIMSEPYNWSPTNSSEVIAFANHVRGLTDHNVTLTLTDDPATDSPVFADDTGDAQSWSQNVAITSITVPVAFGNPTPTYAVVGTLPDGIAFDTSTRVISGTPTEVDSGTITIRATNSEGDDDWTVNYTTTAIVGAPNLPNPIAPYEITTETLTQILPEASGSPTINYLIGVDTLDVPLPFNTADLINSTMEWVLLGAPIDLNVNFSTNPAQQLSIILLRLAFGNVSAGTVTLNVSGGEFTSEFESTGRIILESSEREILEIAIDNADMTDPYGWVPANSAEVIDFANHVRFLSNKTISLTLTLDTDYDITTQSAYDSQSRSRVISFNEITRIIAVRMPIIPDSLSVTYTAVNHLSSVSRVILFNRVPPPNLSPMADAGANQNVEAGVSVSLDGTASSDPDGSIVSYAWTQIAGDTVALTGSSTSTPSFTAPSTDSAQQLSFELTVTDDDGATDTDIVLVGVAATITPISAAIILTNEITSTPQALVDTYGENEIIQIEVVYDQAVDVTGTPQFPVNFGQSPVGGPEYADFARKNGADTLVFEWVVEAADLDTNGLFFYGETDSQNRGDLLLNGGSIRNAGTTVDADLTTTDRGTKSDHKVDGSLGATPNVAPSFTDNTGDDQAWLVGAAITGITVPVASGNPIPTYAVVGSLPVGILFNANTRIISGTPISESLGTITIRASNSEGDDDWTINYTTVIPLVAPSFTDNAGNHQTWTVQQAITPVIVPVAFGNPTPIYTVVGTLPDGIVFDILTRIISGIPTTAGSDTITIRATNSGGNADWTFNYTTIPAPPLPEGDLIFKRVVEIKERILNHIPVFYSGSTIINDIYNAIASELESIFNYISTPDYNPNDINIDVKREIDEYTNKTIGWGFERLVNQFFVIAANDFLDEYVKLYGTSLEPNYIRLRNKLLFYSSLNRANNQYELQQELNLIGANLINNINIFYNVYTIVITLNPLTNEEVLAITQRQFSEILPAHMLVNIVTTSLTLNSSPLGTLNDAFSHSIS